MGLVFYVRGVIRTLSNSFENSITARKLEIERTLSSIFFTKTQRYDCCFVSLTCFIYMIFKWVSLSIFLWTQSNLNWVKKRKLYFTDFLWQVMFKIFQILMKHARLERIPSSTPLFETFASNRPFICNHHHWTIK